MFRTTRDAQAGQGMTKFGRALAELNIEIPCVNSSQVKGRVEGPNCTLQNGLVKELPMASIGTWPPVTRSWPVSSSGLTNASP